MRRHLMIRLNVIALILLYGSSLTASAIPFELVKGDEFAAIYYDLSDSKLVARSAQFFAQDIAAVTGKKPEIHTTLPEQQDNIVLIGTLGESPIIDRLAAQHPELRQHAGDWERYLVTTLVDPFPGIKKALVIIGSDRRGTAYGVFDLSAEIGVSPWYWWADVPAQRKADLILEKDMLVSKSPSVKYRGIFINDEAPALRNWASEQFGGFNHQFYEKVFELILRNKGNYLWPAMWVPSAFASDDPENLRLADEYGIVISTSHHEPMMRAHAEWGQQGGGAWNYETNAANLRDFWRGGITRMGDYESVVTLGMRGDGDEAMSEETAVDLLQKIIADQREIIAEVTEKPVTATPQVWALYKEVQDYYDKGMRVDEDIMLLFCDDNWGNIRILPKAEDLGRKGGFGIYYHFDFVGGPVSYRWLNVTQIERVWEQMNMAYDWGVKDLWLVNVGDIKPMELPISFFLDFAWDTEAIQATDLPNYYRSWARQQFGETKAEEIAEILARYTKYNARRTPEMLSPGTYSLDHYREADRIIEGYQDLLEKSSAIYEALPEEYRAAFYQLVLSPVEFCSNLNEMYVAAGKNQAYAKKGRTVANDYADQVVRTFNRDEELTRYFHEELADGKWNHMMSQTHIGYQSWNNPPANMMPGVSYVHAPQAYKIEFAIERGATTEWQQKQAGGFPAKQQRFAPFDPINDQSFYINIFNQGAEASDYTITANEDWINLTKTSGTVATEDRVYVSIDWEKAPEIAQNGTLTLSGAGRVQQVLVPIRYPKVAMTGFVENNGVVSIEANHYTSKTDPEHISWAVVPNLGRTASGMTVLPANAAVQSPQQGAPQLNYTFTLFEEASVQLASFLSPTLNYKKTAGLQFAVSVDDHPPIIINMHEGETQPDWEYPSWWNNSVTDHIKIKYADFGKLSPGQHQLKVWMIDPGVVFQKFVIDAGGLLPSYLGPPESVYVQP